MTPLPSTRNRFQYGVRRTTTVVGWGRLGAGDRTKNTRNGRLLLDRE
jgi:hypothetical protein